MKLIQTSNLQRQQGMTSVEFVIVALAALIVLFGSMEMSRAMFTLNTLEEATRRGARVAAVCQVNSPAILRTTVFNSSGAGTNSPILPDLTTSNIQLQYLTDTGTAVTGDMSDLAVYASIKYVRVQIINYDHEMILPGFDLSFTAPGYPTTLPIESLGVYPAGISTCV
jgi:Flp pilus assembly protein TadG